MKLSLELNLINQTSSRPKKQNRTCGFSWITNLVSSIWKAINDPCDNNYSLDLQRNTTYWIFEGAYPRPENELEVLHVLSNAFPNFSLDSLLGSGSFSRAYRVSFDSKNERENLVLKFTRFRQALSKPQYFSLNKKTFGGEWLAFLKHGDHVVRAEQALAYDQNTKSFVLIDASYVQDLFDHPEKREEVNLVFIGSISSFIEGAEDLKSRITRNPEGFNIESIRSIGQQILLATQEIHQKGVIHRDIKPANLLINDSDSVQMIDLGCAVSGAYGPSDGYRGSGLYAAPELKEGKEYTNKVDSYAIGASLFQMATGGKHLKEAGSSLNIIQDANLKDLIANLTKTNPDERLSPEQALQHKFFNT